MGQTEPTPTFAAGSKRNQNEHCGIWEIIQDAFLELIGIGSDVSKVGGRPM